jgi:hypothetical protein
MTEISIPRYMGARPEMEIGKLKGETRLHQSWLPEWFRKFLNAPVIRPDYKLSEVLYPVRNGSQDLDSEAG